MWKILKRGVLLKCSKSVKAAPFGVNCDETTKQQNSPQITEVSSSCNHWRRLSREYHSSYEDAGGGYRQAGPECEWKKQSYHCDMWSPTHNCWHFLEAVGWGTTVVTGLQITELYHRSRDRCDDGDRGRCLVKSMINYATAFGWAQLSRLFNEHSWNLFSGTSRIAGAGLLTAKSILPPKIQPAKSVAANQNELESDTCSTYSSKPFSAKQNDDSSVSHKSAYKPSAVTSAFAGQTDAAKAGAASESEVCWQSLAEQCMAAVQCNTDALAHVKRGDIQAAVEMWIKSCGCPVHSPSSLFNLALCYEHGMGVDQDTERAADLYGKAAELGHAKSAFNLAMLLLRDDVPSKSFQKAVELLQKAADLDLKEAQRELGVLYTEPGQQQDMTKAVALFEQASSQQDARAMYFLGICYERGWGVECNEVKAASLYKSAGALGHIEALYNLAVFFENGLGGLPTDFSEAIRYYQAAAVAGHKPAADRLVLLNSQRAPPTSILTEDIRGKHGTDGKYAKTSTDHSVPFHVAPQQLKLPVSDTDQSEYSSMSDSELSGSSSSSISYRGSNLWRLASSAVGELTDVFAAVQPSFSMDKMESCENCSEVASSPDEGHQSFENDDSFQRLFRRHHNTEREDTAVMLSGGTFGNWRT